MLQRLLSSGSTGGRTYQYLNRFTLSYRRVVRQIFTHTILSGIRITNWMANIDRSSVTFVIRSTRLLIDRGTSNRRCVRWHRKASQSPRKRRPCIITTTEITTPKCLITKHSSTMRLILPNVSKSSRSTLLRKKVFSKLAAEMGEYQKGFWNSSSRTLTWSNHQPSCSNVPLGGWKQPRNPTGQPLKCLFKTLSLKPALLTTQYGFNGSLCT